MTFAFFVCVFYVRAAAAATFFLVLLAAEQQQHVVQQQHVEKPTWLVLPLASVIAELEMYKDKGRWGILCYFV